MLTVIMFLILIIPIIFLLVIRLCCFGSSVREIWLYFFQLLFRIPVFYIFCGYFFKSFLLFLLFSPLFNFFLSSSCSFLFAIPFSFSLYLNSLSSSLVLFPPFSSSFFLFCIFLLSYFLTNSSIPPPIPFLSIPSFASP